MNRKTPGGKPPGPRIAREMIVRKGSRAEILGDLWGETPGSMPLDSAQQMIVFLALHRSNQLIRAYQLDRNPDHIFAAWCEFDDMGVLPPETMFKNLRRAIDERKKKPASATKRTTLRSIQILSVIHKDGKIPTRVDTRIVKSLAKSHQMTEVAVRQEISRLRKLFENFQYERPRAYRDG